MNNYIHPADKEMAVKFEVVSFSYGNTLIFQNASFHIHRGEFVAMVGPNGSGKTTVLKLLFGLEKPAAGSIKIFEKPFGHSCDVAYVPQLPPADQAFPITVYDIVRMGLLRPLKRYSESRTAIENAMEQTGIIGLKDKLYRSLSGGQKRRALVARALVSNPQLLVLDEPTANMDAESEARLYETLGACKGKTTILIVTHDTEFVTALTDRVLCLGGGDHGIVQHRTETGDSSHHGAVNEVRVLHGENIPADECG
jgi:zinc transport system ATP-binding protein